MVVSSNIFKQSVSTAIKYDNITYLFNSFGLSFVLVGNNSTLVKKIIFM